MADLLTTGDAARHLGLSPQYLTNLRVWRTGPRWLRVGKHGVRYTRADLDAWRDRARKNRREAA